MPNYRGISPEVNGGADLGSATQRWKTVFANVIDPGAHVNGAFNKKETFTTSGTFVAPITGVYRITLQGGGGGGGASTVKANSYYASSGGGGQGGRGVFYTQLTEGTSYAYIIGAGGSAGTGNDPDSGDAGGGTGGDTSITINGIVYKCTGGGGGATPWGARQGGNGGAFYIGSTKQAQGTGAKGQFGDIIPYNVSYSTAIPAGGGTIGGIGGTGGWWNGTKTQYAAGAGSAGYVEIEYYDPNA